MNQKSKYFLFVGRLGHTQQGSEAGLSLGVEIKEAINFEQFEQ